MNKTNFVFWLPVCASRPLSPSFSLLHLVWVLYNSCSMPAKSITLAFINRVYKLTSTYNLIIHLFCIYRNQNTGLCNYWIIVLFRLPGNGAVWSLIYTERVLIWHPVPVLVQYQQKMVDWILEKIYLLSNPIKKDWTWSQRKNILELEIFAYKKTICFTYKKKSFFFFC